MSVAKRAGDIIMSYYKTDRLDVQDKRENDVVTAADFASDTYIQEQLGQLFPNDQIFTEETLHPITDRSGGVWIVNPLDGTNNFSQQKDDFCVMIGRCTNAVPDMGVIYFPVTQQFFVAQKGQGAWRSDSDGQNRVALNVSACASLDEARVFCSRSYMLPQYAERLFREETALVRAPSGERIVVSSSPYCMGYKSCLVAAGALDVHIYLSNRMGKRDTCAPQIILEEAGAFLTEIDGSPLDYTQESPFRERGHITAIADLHPMLVNFLK